MKPIYLSVLLIFIFFSGLAVVFHERSDGSESFVRILVDPHAPRDPWGKSVGDVDGDGLTDLVVAGHAPRKPILYRRILNRLHILGYEWPKGGELVWYKNGSWQKFLISGKYNFRTDVEVADIDHDGRPDVVALADQGLFWFRGPHWEPFQIDDRRLHDVEVSDLDQDGDLDLVARNQSLFGADNGDVLHIYRQDGPGQWFHFSLPAPQGEGLLVLDVNQDGRPDIVANQVWFQNPGTLNQENQWLAHTYCASWDWPDAFLDSADLNQDGRPDILMSPAEIAGDRYRVSWCDLAAEGTTDGQEHVIDADVESVIHSIRAGDFDGDGNLDVVTAKMYQGEDPDVVSVYWNQGSARNWRKETVSDRGSHSMRVLDYDNDGVDEFFGANWEGDYQKIELWENKKKSRH